MNGDAPSDLGPDVAPSGRTAPTWRSNDVLRWLVALAAAFALVAAVAHAMKLVATRILEIGYVIHWFETVPFLVVALAWLLERRWRRAD